MTKGISRIGNSYGVIIGKRILDKANINIKDNLQIEFENGKIILTKVK